MTGVPRRDTLKFVFDCNYARPKSYEIEAWIEESLKSSFGDIIGVHLSIVSSTVYIKFRSPEICDEIVQSRAGNLKFKHCDGNVGEVKVTHAGFGIRTVRIFELPFEVPAEDINAALAKYGKVVSNVAEKWMSFKVPVLNGVRQVKIELKTHIPSYISICGYRAIIMYDGQPRTCSGCGSTGHVRAQCIQRRVTQVPTGETAPADRMTTLPISYVAAARLRPNTPEHPHCSESSGTTEGVQETSMDIPTQDNSTEDVTMEHDQPEGTSSAGLQYGAPAQDDGKRPSPSSELEPDQVVNEETNSGKGNLLLRKSNSSLSQETQKTKDSPSTRR